MYFVCVCVKFRFNTNVFGEYSRRKNEIKKNQETIKELLFMVFTDAHALYYRRRDNAILGF